MNFIDLLEKYIESCDSFPYDKIIFGTHDAQAISINNWLSGEKPEPKIEEFLIRLLKKQTWFRLKISQIGAVR
jgi:hypothetical protein